MKRQDVMSFDSDTSDRTLLAAHPYGVRPMGNLLVDRMCSSEGPAKRVTAGREGLGAVAALPDHLVCVLTGLLAAPDLCALASVSRAFMVFAHDEDTWRELVVRHFNGGFTFVSGCLSPDAGPCHTQCTGQCGGCNGWKVTYQVAHRLACLQAAGDPEGVLAGLPLEPKPRVAALRALLPVRHVPIRFPLYSDHLFQPFFCTAMGIDPSWLTVENIDRRSGLSLADFISTYEEPNRPVVLTDVVPQWPAFKKWDRDYLFKNFHSSVFRCGAVDMKLSDYWAYSDQCHDDRPLYLFDCKFADKRSDVPGTPSLADDYTVPKYFDEDLFSLLGSDRPNFRWLIAGAARSGSTFHIDPNQTSAWNATLTGSKKWIMFPPSCVPPGVHPSADGSVVASPIAILEWFHNFYSATKDVLVKPVECITRAGDIIFVPHGWWHIVLNLEPSMALTQNFCSRRNLLPVLRFLRCKSDQVSGVTMTGDEVADRLETEFEARFPGELAALKAADDAKRAEAAKPSAWAAATSGADKGFSFGFS